MNRKLVVFHLRCGWWSLAVFVAAGLAIDYLHGFKAGLYLDADQETRRWLWKIAHGYGGVIGLLNVFFPFLASRAWLNTPNTAQLVSRLLLSATILIPGGLFFGGLFAVGSQSGISIAASAAGLVMLSSAALLLARP